MFAGEFREFSRAILDGSSPPYPFTDARANTRAVLALIQAAREERSVAIPL
jgi:predicted dehydrogenase